MPHPAKSIKKYIKEFTQFYKPEKEYDQPVQYPYLKGVWHKLALFEKVGKNLLNAGHHIGVNTQGCSMRNANRGLRSEPPNPQVQVSPWQQSSICPDLYRKPLDCPN